LEVIFGLPAVQSSGIAASPTSFIEFNFHGSMHHVSNFVNKTSLMQFLGIYCILVSSTCFGRYVHPSSGAQLCTGGKVQYMCAVITYVKLVK